MPTLTRTRNSRSRPESWRCAWSAQLMSNVTTSASLETDSILLLFILASVSHILNSFICYLSSFTLCSPLAIHWTISFLSRRVFPLLWLAPTNWLRLKERRSVVVCTHGEWLKWRTQSTMTSLNYAPCLCESPWGLKYSSRRIVQRKMLKTLALLVLGICKMLKKMFAANLYCPLVCKKNVCCRTHMQDLQEVTQDLHYENFRSERLKRACR